MDNSVYYLIANWSCWISMLSGNCTKSYDDFSEICYWSVGRFI